MFEQICNKHAPIKKHRIKQTTCNLPRLDSEILKLIRERGGLKVVKVVLKQIGILIRK